MARRRPVAVEDRHEREEDRERRLAALRIRLYETAREIRTAGDWARCLHAAARLPGENWANVLLISSQRPGATMVMGYEAWRAAGRQVNRDEKGIEIFSDPRQQRGNPHGDEQAHSWRDARRVAYVWDLSQTSGKPIPAPAALPSSPGGVQPGLWDSLCWLARREGFAVERECGCPEDGTTLWAARRIRVLPDLTSGQAVWALAHQLGHVLLHNTIAYSPGTTTSGCQGVRKAEADSVAFIICARHGVAVEHTFSSPQSWAGSDPRAQPAATILATGERITTAAARISSVLDRHLAASAAAETTTLTSQDEDETPRVALRIAAPAAATAPSPEPDPRILGVLADAEEFYVGQLASSWVPAYLRRRGLSDEVMVEWHVGYAPRGWTALTDYLRGRGHGDDVIQAAGLARISSRGTLIDHFRDRVMLPVHDEHGNLAGFTGRAHPGAGPAVPKYLNSPETSTYKKSDLLFGLHQARDRLAHGATPVIVEGPFDAIAVTLAGRGRYAGLAPCGTALTTQQAEALSRSADLRQTGVLVAFDDDAAGRKAAVRAYDILRAVSDRLQSTMLSGRDPAEILEAEGAAALRTVLQRQLQPLSAVVIDAHIDPWERRLQDTEGPLLAMRSVATVIAGLLPAKAVEAVRQITGDRELTTVDERMQPVVNPELPEIARVLPADTAYQITRAAERLGFIDYSDVLAEVANAVTRKAVRPKDVRHGAAPRLAGSSFPHPPLTIQDDAEPATARQGRSGNRLKLGRLVACHPPERVLSNGSGLRIVNADLQLNPDVRAYRRLRSADSGRIAHCG
jgi:DNA primase